MCEATTMMALMATSKAAEISSTNQAAEAAQTAAIEQQRVQDTQTQYQAEEVKSKAALELAQTEREALRKQAARRVSAAESGVAGASHFRNLMDVSMQKSFEQGSIISLQETDLAGLGLQSQADMLRTRSTINQAEGRKSTGLSSALQIGAAAGQGYAVGGGFSEASAGLPWYRR